MDQKALPLQDEKPQEKIERTRLYDTFPTLQEVFEGVPEGMAFNVEIKHPLGDENTKNALVIERNEYLDTILDVL